MLIPQDKDVKIFLDEFKQKLTTFGVFFVNRPKNLQTLADLEITPKYREQILKELTNEDYCQGPLNNDQYGNNPMWVFGKIIKGQEVYIKITTANTAICISFHLAERQLTYPLKKML